MGWRPLSPCDLFGPSDGIIGTPIIHQSFLYANNWLPNLNPIIPNDITTTSGYDCYDAKGVPCAWEGFGYVCMDKEHNVGEYQFTIYPEQLGGTLQQCAVLAFEPTMYSLWCDVLAFSEQQISEDWNQCLQENPTGNFRMFTHNSQWYAQFVAVVYCAHFNGCDNTCPGTELPARIREKIVPITDRLWYRKKE